MTSQVLHWLSCWGHYPRILYNMIPFRMGWFHARDRWCQVLQTPWIRWLHRMDRSLKDSTYHSDSIDSLSRDRSCYLFSKYLLSLSHYLQSYLPIPLNSSRAVVSYWLKYVHSQYWLRSRSGQYCFPGKSGKTE